MGFRAGVCHSPRRQAGGGITVIARCPHRVAAALEVTLADSTARLVAPASYDRTNPSGYSGGAGGRSTAAVSGSSGSDRHRCVGSASIGQATAVAAAGGTTRARTIVHESERHE